MDVIRIVNYTTSISTEGIIEKSGYVDLFAGYFDLGTHINGDKSTARFRNPYSVDYFHNATGKTDYVFVSDDEPSLRKISLTSSSTSPPFADNSFDVEDLLNYPLGFSGSIKSMACCSRINEKEFLFIITDTSIRRVNIEATNDVELIAGHDTDWGMQDGISTNARFKNLRDIKITGTGDQTILYVTDAGNNNIRRIDVNTQNVTTLFGSKIGTAGYLNGYSTNALFNYPKGILLINDKFLLVSDANNFVIRKIDLLSGEVSLFLGTQGSQGFIDGDQQNGTLPQLNEPSYFELDDYGNILFSDLGNKLKLIYAKPKRIEETLVMNLTENSAIISWTKPLNGGFEISNHSIILKDLKNDETVFFYSNSNSSIALSNLQQNTNYSYSIYAENVIGKGVESITTTFLTLTACNSVLSTESSVCSSHGNCSAPETCDCLPQFNGTNCQFFNCFDISENDPSVCSGFGSCQSFNNCSCTTGYVGEKCEIPICFSKNASDLSVCSGNGVCLSFDNCQCNSNYTGNNCEVPICFSKNASDSEVCNGNGSCENPNNCSCSNGYEGSQCEYPICYGKSEITTDSPCSSPNGICSSPNNCTCSNGYEGNQCDQFKCFGILFDDNLSCGLNGSCISPDICNCTVGYEGDSCQSYKCFGTVFNDSSSCNGNNGLCFSRCLQLFEWI